MEVVALRAEVAGVLMVEALAEVQRVEAVGAVLVADSVEGAMAEAQRAEAVEELMVGAPVAGAVKVGRLVGASTGALLEGVAGRQEGVALVGTVAQAARP